MISQLWFMQWPGAMRQQVITWAKVYPDLCHHMASLDHTELLYAYTQRLVWYINTWRPGQDGCHFADIFTCIFINENCCILTKFSLKYVRKDPIDNNPALVQIMSWRRSGNKPLSEPMMISLLTHICITRPQWVKQWNLMTHMISVNWVILFCHPGPLFLTRINFNPSMDK